MLIGERVRLGASLWLPNITTHSEAYSTVTLSECLYCRSKAPPPKC
jgi:hypothetical protein